MTENPWNVVLRGLRRRIPPEDFRHWLEGTSYASDSGDQITVWVPTEPIRRHINMHYAEMIDEALAGLGRANVHVRFVVTGTGDDDDDEE